MDNFGENNIKNENTAAASVQPTDTDKFRGVYDDTLYFVDGIVQQYDFYADIVDALRNGNAKLELKKRYMLKAIDEEWVTKIEDALPALDEIIRKPSRFIEETERVLPIELSRNISSRSIKHLSQHTDYISKVDGDTVTPSKILNVFRDETIHTYENKFINTLVNRLYIFVERRYETALKEGKDEKNTSLDFSEEFVHGELSAKMHFSVEISEEPKDGEHLKNYTYTTDLWQRVIRLHHICAAYMNSDFVRDMDRQYVRPPIVRTNALLKNKNLRQCLELWEYIESYENVGYNMLVQENLEDIDPRYIRELYYSSALQYLIFRYNIKNEFDAEKTLSSVETENPLEPRIVDEQGEIKASNYDKVYKKYVRVREDVRGEKRRRTLRDRSIVRAIDVALIADSLLKNNTPLPSKIPAPKKPSRFLNGIKKTADGAKRNLKAGAKKAVKRADDYCRTHQKQLTKVADMSAELALSAAMFGVATTVKMFEKRK